LIPGRPSDNAHYVTLSDFTPSTSPNRCSAVPFDFDSMKIKIKIEPLKTKHTHTPGGITNSHLPS
ncbi:MAG: hypothetical protein MUP25_02295, partial [Syntrophales bacterium]|nr:hypothetical protein [Syntrophales bacterium]